MLPAPHIVLAPWLDLPGVILDRLRARVRHTLQAEDRKDPINVPGIPDGVGIAGPLLNHHLRRDSHRLELLLEDLGQDGSHPRVPIDACPEADAIRSAA